MQKAKLENWSVIGGNKIDPYTPPEFITHHLVGNVFGHPKFSDNTFIKTSRIRKAEGENIIITNNTEYTLGEIDQKYETQFPNAKERVFNSLKKEVKR